MQTATNMADMSIRSHCYRAFIRLRADAMVYPWERRSRWATLFKMSVIMTSLYFIVWVVVVMTRRDDDAKLTLLAAKREIEAEIAKLQAKIQKTARETDSGELLDALTQSNYKLSQIENFLQSETAGLFYREIPPDRTLNREYRNDKSDLYDFVELVTVLIYADKDDDCVMYQVKTVAKRLPNVRIILATDNGISGMAFITDYVTAISRDDARTEGHALNTMISQVKTPYFLYLSQGAVVSPFHTDHGPGWLLHALLNVPELDFIGGSILTANKSLRYAQLEVQCYRLRMCYYVFSQSYEYKYSVGDVMICEETSTSFMARTTSIAKIGGFDETLRSMVTTDFFWRAKDKLIAGLRPEVFFHVDKKCFVDTLPKRDESFAKQSFMEKYELVRVKDSYGKVTEALDPYRSLIGLPEYSAPSDKFDYVKDGGVASPLVTEQLKYYIRFFDDFFSSHNVTYFVDSGIALGGVKTRSVLPWDTGDEDAGYYNWKWEDMLKALQRHCALKKVDCHLKTTLSRFKVDVGAPITTHTIETRIGNPRGAHCDIYCHVWEAAPKSNDLMYVYIDGIHVPALRSLFASFRARNEYDMTYLRQRGSRGDLQCGVKGHHACVPEAFRFGGGHWRDFYCNL